jgi:hypothetical protein
MVTKLNVVRSIAVVATLAAAWALPTAAVAQKDSPNTLAIAAQQNQTALAQNQVPRLILVIPANRGGNILRARPSNLATAQPSPLDSTQSGNANVKQPPQANLPPRSSLSLGK